MRKSYFLLLVSFCVGCTAGRIDRAITKADALRGTQRYAEALRAYEFIALEFPTHPRVADVLLRVGDLYYYNLQEPSLAASAYRRVAEEWLWQPAAIQARRRLAEIAIAAEDYPAAVEAYERLLKYYPAYEEWDIVRHAIGVCYLKQRQYAQARIELVRLLEREGLRPDVHVHALYDLAETYVLEGKPAAAIPYYQRLVEAFPNHDLVRQARLQLSACYEEGGDYGAAFNLLQVLRRQYPDDPTIHKRWKQVQERKATIGRPGKLPW